ncbi:GNAT family N-acetyltransferase [Butyrivibrio sp. AE2032]|uniref:GNAT family N-acetyltransferase n=1 Tax=Butyrivibrio sp. AE2032 TaxID=1458463 RepID=UPI0005543048|nr:GNAT family N-acetyltransferase [Butyrivibrio sp. AE2032]
MKITPITKENLDMFQGFITDIDAQLIQEDMEILPLGLVADDLQEGKNLAAGAICLRPDDYELKITSFYVSKDYRGKGGGKFLLDEAKRLFGNEGMEFDIEFLIYGKEEEGLALFLEKYGFAYADPEYEVACVTVADLEKTKLYDKPGKGEKFSNIPEKLFNISQSEAAKNGAILPVDGLKSERIEKDISVGIVNGDIIEAFVVFEKLSDKVLLLSSFYTKDDNSIALLHVLEKSANLILDKYSGVARILIQPVNDIGIKLTESVFEDANIISCRYSYFV